MEIVVRGFPRIAEENDIVEFLEQTVEAQNITVCSPFSKLRGIVFCKFPTSILAESACATLNNVRFEGAKLKASLRCSKRILEVQTEHDDRQVRARMLTHEDNNLRPTDDVEGCSGSTRLNDTSDLNCVASAQKALVPSRSSQNASSPSESLRIDANIVLWMIPILSQNLNVYTSVLQVMKSYGFYPPMITSQQNDHMNNQQTVSYSASEEGHDDIIPQHNTMPVKLEGSSSNWTFKEWNRLVTQGIVKASCAQQMLNDAATSTINTQDPKYGKLFASHEIGDCCNCLYVKNLPLPHAPQDSSGNLFGDAKETVLCHQLIRIFGIFVSPHEQYNQDELVLSIRCFVRGRMRGQAFIAYRTIGEAEKAQRALHGYWLSISPDLVGHRLGLVPKPKPILISFRANQRSKTSPC